METKRYALLAEHRESTWGGSLGGCQTYTVSAVHVEDETPRNIGLDEYQPDPLAGIVLTAQASHESDLPTTYAWRLGAQFDETATLAQLTATLATLRKVQTRLDKLSADIGPAGTFGQFVARVASALGIPVLTGHTARDGFYSSGEYTSWASGDIASVLDGWTAAYQRKEV